jgi:hypothetical protein
MESGLDPNKQHDKDRNTGQYTGYGIYGARLDRRTKMLSWLKENKFAANSAEGQMRQMVHSAMTDFPLTRKRLMNASEGSITGDSWVVTKDFENPTVVNNRTGATIGAYAAGAPDNRPAVLKQTQGPKAIIGHSPEEDTPKLHINTTTAPEHTSLNTPSIQSKAVASNIPTTYSQPAQSVAEASQPASTSPTQVASNTSKTEFPEFNSPQLKSSSPPSIQSSQASISTPPLNTNLASAVNSPSLSQVPESDVLPAPTRRPPAQEEAVASATEQPSHSLSQYSGIGSTQISPHFQRIQNNMGLLFFGTESIG